MMLLGGSFLPGPLFSELLGVIVGISIMDEGRRRDGIGAEVECSRVPKLLRF